MRSTRKYPKTNRRFNLLAEPAQASPIVKGPKKRINYVYDFDRRRTGDEPLSAVV
ncbi:MAG: hypothetical protein HFG75_07630 [Hungatella sp.]|nr:hypothetical protein [Hungatella sp.]